MFDVFGNFYASVVFGTGTSHSFTNYAFSPTLGLVDIYEDVSSHVDTLVGRGAALCYIRRGLAVNVGRHAQLR